MKCCILYAVCSLLTLKWNDLRQVAQMRFWTHDKVEGNVKHLCGVCLKGVGVNSIRCTQCVQWFMQGTAE